MTAPTYLTTCPKCGAQLQPVALDPATAPWLCANDARGFWAAELSTSARTVYRPRHDDWTLSGARAPIQADVDAEIAQAQSRGTSLREDQISLASAGVLQSVVGRRGVDTAFAALVTAHLHAIGAV